MVVRSLLTLLGFQGDDKKLSKYGDALKGILNVGKLVIGATIALAGATTKLAGDMEQVQIAFETMLGSAEKADTLLKEITDFAASTPFELTGLIDSSKQLLAFGFAAEEIIPTMTTLGNIAAGVGKDKLPTIVRSLGKIRTKGKASMEELNMMLEAGVPILDTLSEQLGVSTEELFKMISAGKIGFNDVNNALTSMGTGTGRFGGLMEKQSKSFLGILSNIGDWFTNFMIAVGQDLLPMGKELGKAFLDFLEANKNLMKSGLVQFIKGVAFGIVFVIRFLQRLLDHFGSMEGAMNGIQNILKGIGDWGLKALKGLGKAIFMIADAVNEVIEWFGGWDAVTKGLADVMSFLGDALSFILEILGFVISIIIKFIGLVARDLVRAIEDAGKFFVQMGNLINDIANFLVAVWTGFSNFFINLWKGIVNFFIGVGKVIKNLWSAFLDWWNKLWEKVSEVALGVWDNIVKGIQDAWQNVVNFITNLWQELMGVIGGVLDFGKGVADFFGGVFGGGPSPESTVGATGAGTGSTLNVNSTINTMVPEGTPEQQTAIIQQNARDAVRKEWNLIMKDGLVNLPQ